jgi:hypothetical protein
MRSYYVHAFDKSVINFTNSINESVSSFFTNKSLNNIGNVHN